MMILEKPYFTKDFPSFKHEHYEEEEKIFQADWKEEDKNSPSYILNKPNFILSVNGIGADANGNIVFKSIQEIDSIPNQTIYAACEDVLRGE